jgi:hypothetical protein
VDAAADGLGFSVWATDEVVEDTAVDEDDLDVPSFPPAEDAELPLVLEAPEADDVELPPAEMLLVPGVASGR